MLSRIGQRAFHRGTGKSVALPEVFFVSIILVGLAETKNFAEGYGAIFGGKKKEKKETPPIANAGAAKKKKSAKKKKQT